DDGEAQRRPLAEHVLLADELLERAWPQPLRERGDLPGALGRRVGEEVSHAASMLRGVAVTSLRAEVSDLLSRLIRIDTTNPPGNETAAAELLRDYLVANGVE